MLSLSGKDVAAKSMRTVEVLLELDQRSKYVAEI